MNGDTALGKSLGPRSLGSSSTLSALEHSSPSTSVGSASASSHDADEDAAWGLMDALYWQTARVSLTDTVPTVNEEVSMRQALADDLDGTAFRAHSASSSVMSTPSISQSEMEIPNFPPLSLALLRDESSSSSEDVAVPRTSGTCNYSITRSG